MRFRRSFLRGLAAVIALAGLAVGVWLWLRDSSFVAVTAVRVTGAPVEIGHLVVQQEPTATDDDSRSPAILQRVGVGDRHAAGVDNRKMGRAFPFVRQRDLGREPIAARRVLQVDAAGELRGVLFAGQLLWRLDEIWIANVPRAIAKAR